MNKDFLIQSIIYDDNYFDSSWHIWLALCSHFSLERAFLLSAYLVWVKVAQSCPAFCDPMNYSMPGFSIYHQLPEPAQTHVHWVWCHSTISFSLVPFFSCLQSFPALGSFPVSQVFASGGQSIGASASASVLPMNIQDWFPLGLMV